MGLVERNRSAASAVVHGVVLNWNGAERTLACLRALEGVAYPALDVLVVDNGSTDDSVAQIRAAYPPLQLACTGRNLGFAGGCNVGVARALAAGADFVWLLNNDALPDAGALDAMVARALADPAIGAVGSLLPAGPAGGAAVWGGGRVSLVTGLARHVTPRRGPTRVDYLQGASLLLRCAALRAVGPLDDGFFLYWEDADLCFRLRRAGWRLAVAGDAVVQHPGNGSLALASPEWDFHFTASSVRFLRRYAPLPVVPIAVSVLGRMARRALHGRWGNVRAVAAGFRRGVVAAREEAA